MLNSISLRKVAILNLIVTFATFGPASSATDLYGTNHSVLHGITRTATTSVQASTLPAGVSVPSYAVVTTNVQALSGWKICVGSCAGGKTPTSYKMTQHVASASRNNDGMGTTFSESGVAFGDVMWYVSLGNSSAKNFVLDFWMKIDKPQNVQALEYAILKRDSTYWYKGSTQCNYISGALRGYNVSTHSWQSLGANCMKATAGTWQHVTIQYSISSGKTEFQKANFGSLLQTMTASLPRQSESSTSSSMGVHFQLDNANTTSGYTVSVDNWTVYSW
jgi:hypothetical protein